MTVKIDHIIPATDKSGRNFTKRELTRLKSARHKQDKCTETRAKYATALNTIKKIRKIQQYGEFFEYQGMYLSRVRCGEGEWVSVGELAKILDSLTP